MGKLTMEFVIDAYDEGLEVLNTGIEDIDGDELNLVNTDGYGGSNIAIGANSGITWEELDKLKEAIKLAEQRWRPNHDKTTNI